MASTERSELPGNARLDEAEPSTDSRVLCTEEGCSEEAEFDVVETIFGVDLPGRAVCMKCAGLMGMAVDDE